MSARSRTVYVCSACGNDSAKWQGQCPACGAWNTLGALSAPREIKPGRRRPPPGPATVVALAAATAVEAARLATGSAEFDRVLGGGLVAGSATLIGGEPGIGKSTLLLQAAARLAATTPVLYATGEESLEQLGLRARRLKLEATPLQLIAETDVEAVLAAASLTGARVLVIDSIQTMAAAEVEASPGSVSQLRESAARFTAHAKRSGAAVVLIGHVTKEGVIAGPRMLEHLVDTVLYFECEAGSRYRIVRAVKNRYGAAHEIGVFAMEEQGLKDVSNPSAIFLSRHPEPVAGSLVTVVREGSRPMLVEVQALVDPSALQLPRRVSVGFEPNRLALLLAVLHRHGGIALGAHDVYLNIVGGLKVEETAADLPALLAAVSSHCDRPLPAELVAFGELGLAGEIRPVPAGEERLREAAKHGFKRALVPSANVPRRALPGIEVEGVARLEAALAAVRGA